MGVQNPAGGLADLGTQADGVLHGAAPQVEVAVAQTRLLADLSGVELGESGGTTRKVPVTIGLFAGGRVEISGKDISEGQRVVVPQT